MNLFLVGSIIVGIAIVSGIVLLVFSLLGANGEPTDLERLDEELENYVRSQK